MSKRKKHLCESCVFCNYAQKRPDALIGKLWKWHTGWCPMWKSYQRSLAKGESLAESEPLAEGDSGEGEDKDNEKD